MSAAGVASLPETVGVPGPLDVPDAACLAVPPDLMHPVVGGGKPGAAYHAAVAEAQKVCALCPADVRRQCLAYALAWPGEVSGVWGGLDERQLNAMKRGGPAGTSTVPGSAATSAPGRQ